MKDQDTQPRMNKVDSTHPTDNYSYVSGESDNAREMAETKRRLEELEQKKKEIDDRKNTIAEREEKKEQLIRESQEVREFLVSSIKRISKEINDMRIEADKLENIRDCFQRDFDYLSKINPEEWHMEDDDFVPYLEKAMDGLAHCVDHCEQAVTHCSLMRHTNVLEEGTFSQGPLITSREFMLHLVKGFAFHLPLIVLFLIVFSIYSCSQPSM